MRGYGGIRDEFGLQKALDYLIGEKLFGFVAVAEQSPEFAAELPHLVSEIRKIFSAQEIRSYLDELEHFKFLSPREGAEDSSLDGEHSEGEILDNPVLGAEEILRFARIKELLQSGI